MNSSKIKNLLSGFIKALLYFLSGILFLNALFFVALGVFKSYKAWLILFTDGFSTNARPGLLIGESVDSILLGVVFILFSFGMGQLFDKDKAVNHARLTDIKKTMLASIILVISVYYVTLVVNPSNINYWQTFAVIPFGIFMLGLTLYFYDKSTRENKS